MGVPAEPTAAVGVAGLDPAEPVGDAGEEPGPAVMGAQPAPRQVALEPGTVNVAVIGAVPQVVQVATVVVKPGGGAVEAAALQGHDWKTV